MCPVTLVVDVMLLCSDTPLFLIYLIHLHISITLLFPLFICIVFAHFPPLISVPSAASLMTVPWKLKGAPLIGFNVAIGTVTLVPCLLFMSTLTEITNFPISKSYIIHILQPSIKILMLCAGITIFKPLMLHFVVSGVTLL